MILSFEASRVFEIDKLMVKKTLSAMPDATEKKLFEFKMIEIRHTSCIILNRWSFCVTATCHIRYICNSQMNADSNDCGRFFVVKNSFDSIVKIINNEIWWKIQLCKRRKKRRCVEHNVNKMGFSIKLIQVKKIKNVQPTPFISNSKLSIKYCCFLCHRNNGFERIFANEKKK